MNRSLYHTILCMLYYCYFIYMPCIPRTSAVLISMVVLFVVVFLKGHACAGTPSIAPTSRQVNERWVELPVMQPS